MQDEISGKRARRKEEIEACLNEFGTAEMKFSIRFNGEGDRNKFVDHLHEGDLLSHQLHGNYKAKLWPEKIAATATPIEFAEAVLAEEPSRLAREVKRSGGSCQRV